MGSECSKGFDDMNYSGQYSICTNKCQAVLQATSVKDVMYDILFIIAGFIVGYLYARFNSICKNAFKEHLASQQLPA
uniref:Uncharacterized protein n=1 Tax=Panagrolaimus superbus TaxID=310955 RepID=A0A914XZP3_9BILA